MQCEPFATVCRRPAESTLHDTLRCDAMRQLTLSLPRRLHFSTCIHPYIRPFSHRDRQIDGEITAVSRGDAIN